MKTKQLALSFLLVLGLAASLKAGIERVDLQVQGMT